jgi:shikimate dehydrogenase
MHGAAYRSLGMPHAYEKVETTEAELPGRVADLRSGLWAGLNVTVPHKTKVLALVDEVAASARATGAGNTLVRVGPGRVRAYNTDAPALEEELTSLAKGAQGAASFEGKSALVLGTGGAARAAVFALGKLGVATVHVRGRSRRDDLAAVLAAASPSASLVFSPLVAPASEPDDLAVIVQASSAGMQGAASGDVVADAVAWATVPPDCVAYDVVYTPPHTAFLARAAAASLAHAGGLGMLAVQGALAFELWLGVAPRAVMKAALEGERS